MLFEISRTSSVKGDGPPCEGATREDENSPWVIEVADLEALLKLSRAETPWIVSSYASGFPEIEIYDDYRE
jgi:hypothetical protein